MIADIINDLTNNHSSLTNALTKTKVMATRIANDELLTWVNRELAGYVDSQEVPLYRKLRGDVTVNYIFGYRQVTNFPLALNLGKETNEVIETANFSQSVQQLEKIADSRESTLRYEFPSSKRQLLQQLLQKVNGSNFQLTSAGINLPPGAVDQILATIRQRLLDFMLELEMKFGMEVDVSTLQQNHKIIYNYMQTIINNNGDGNTINTGKAAKLKANITINKGVQQELKESLSENGVPSVEIDELLSFIDSEAPDPSGRFGQKVNEWIAKMLSKALDGSWEIGIGAAGGFLGTAIAKYYGIQ